MGAQRFPVLIDLVEHHGRYREHHASRREFSFGENMMDQTAVQPAISILEWVNIHKPKCRGRRLQYWIEVTFPHAVISLQHSLHQIFEIRGPRTDELRQWITLIKETNPHCRKFKKGWSGSNQALKRKD